MVPWNKGLPREQQPRYGVRYVMPEKTRMKIRRTKLERPTRYWSGKKRSEETKNKISKSQTGKPAWNKGLTKDTDERVRLYSIKAGLSRVGKVAWNKGLKGWTIGTRAGFQIGHLGYPNNGQFKKGDIPWIKGKKGMFVAWNKGKEMNNEFKEKARLSMFKRRKDGVYSLRPNKTEQHLIQLFHQNNLPFKYTGDGNFWVDYFNPDFVDEDHKKIIEFDGRYWHSRPKELIKDQKRNLAYKHAGYNFIIINEDNLKDEGKLIEDIKQFCSIREDLDNRI